MVRGKDPKLFLQNVSILVVMSAQFSGMTAAFILLNSRSGCILTVLHAIVHYLCFNAMAGNFDSEFWKKQGPTWHCGTMFNVTEIVLAVVLFSLLSKER